MDLDNNSDSINRSVYSLSIRESDQRSPSSHSQDTNDSMDVQVALSVGSSPILQKKLQKVNTVNRPPPFNVPEKIIFCLDTCIDVKCSEFQIGEGSASYPSLCMLKRAIEIFVQNKNYMDHRHEFGLISLDDKTVKWAQEFTNNPRDIIKSLNDIKVTECDEEAEFDLSELLETVWQMVTVPKCTEHLNNHPLFVVRLIIMSSRNSKAFLEKQFNELLTNPYFIIDVILSYEESSEDNKVQEIFYSLQIDEKGYSYNFAVGRNAMILHESMAKLLAHPLQRPLQDQATYNAPIFEAEE